MGRLMDIKLRRDTAANWTSVNPVLDAGEPGYETDTKRVKIGDGSTAWTSLGYAPLGGPVQICDSVLGSDGTFDTNTILGGNIPALFKHLQIVLSIRSDRAATTDVALLRFNNDSTAANYYSEENVALAGGAVSGTSRNGTLGGVDIVTAPAANSPASSFMAGEITIVDYLSANHKGAISKFFSRYDTTTGTMTGVQGGLWLNTAAITRIALVPNVGTNWKTGSRFTLYGIT